MYRIDHFQVQNEVQHSLTLLTNLFNKQTVLFYGPFRRIKNDIVLIINRKVCQGGILALKKVLKFIFESHEIVVI